MSAGSVLARRAWLDAFLAYRTRVRRTRSARRRERAVRLHLIDSRPADGHRAPAGRNGVRIPDGPLPTVGHRRLPPDSHPADHVLPARHAGQLASSSAGRMVAPPAPRWSLAPRSHRPRPSPGALRRLAQTNEPCLRPTASRLAERTTSCSPCRCPARPETRWRCVPATGPMSGHDVAG